MDKSNLLFSFKPSWNLDKHKKTSGFTLIELLIVITMIGIMFSLLILFLDPFKQIQKARDSQRVQNLKQITQALDTYYNDINCYPLSLSFGNSWQQNAAIYMKQIPQDPSCASGGSCYTYVTDISSSCPAWNVLFAKIYQSTANSSSCSLQSNCLPANYEESGYNYCVLSGNVDCAYISSLSLPANAGAGTGGSGGSGGNTPTPGPTSASTPTPTPFCSLNYSCTGNPLRCNVIAPAGSGQYCSSNCDGNCL